MKMFQLILIFAILGFCFSDDADQCSIDFENILLEKCESISSCSFTSFSDYTRRCISTKNEGCSKADGDQTLCEKIFPNTFPKQKCYYDSDNKCKAKNIECNDFNANINGVNFDRLKDRDTCGKLNAPTEGKKCLLANSYSKNCREYFSSCNGLSSTDCNNNLLDDYTLICQYSDGACNAVKRDCDNTLYNVNENECHSLKSKTPTTKQCIYNKNLGSCFAQYTSCESYIDSTATTIDPNDCNGERPLVLRGDYYEFDDSKECKYNEDEKKCEAKYISCNDYTGSDSNICQYLEVTDSTNKRCAYDPTRTSSVCREVYKTCQLFNDKVEGKARNNGCEKNILSDPNKKCIYIEEVDKCIETSIYLTCEDYNGTDKYVCESIRSSTTHSKCILEKDRKCIERAFNCSEAYNEEDCLVYAKPHDRNKICVYNSGKCYEVYKNCENYLETDTTTTCPSLTLYNGNSCYRDSNSNRCRSNAKTCSQVYNKDECLLIAETGVSDPDKKVCDYIKYDTETTEHCVENYKYCSDYRGGDDAYHVCAHIKPYDESGKNIDITSKCEYTTDVGCERVSKDCDDEDVRTNPILCSLISPNIQDNNVKYCVYIDDGVGYPCKKHYKTCESYTGTVQSECEAIIPQNYLTIGHCVWKDSKCVPKTDCDTFKVDDYKYLCENKPNCTYLGGICQKTTQPESCKDVKFYIASDENEEVCKNIESESPNKKCSLKLDKSGCEEILNEESLETTTTQENSSGTFIQEIHIAMALICLLL